MVATVSDYNPLLFSELLAPAPNGSFNLCRAASLAMLFDAGTLGEWTTDPNGSRWGKAKVKATLIKMRAETGQPNADSYNQGDVPAFLRGMGAPKDAWEKRNVSWEDLMDDLRRGFTLDFAGDVKHTPVGSPLRKFVNPNVGHDIVLLRVNDKTDQVAFIDPMTPPGTARHVRTAPKSHFIQFGSEFRAGGNYVAGRIKKGKYTQEAIVRRNAAPGVFDLQQRVKNLQHQIETLKKEAKGDSNQIALLEQHIIELQHEIDTQVNREHISAGLDMIESAVTGLRQLL